MNLIQGVPAALSSPAQAMSALGNVAPGNITAGGSAAGSNTVGGIPADNSAVGKSDASSGTSAFRQLMVDGLRQVETLQQSADLAVQQLASHPGGTSEVLTAVQQADLSFRTMMQIRDQLVQAYQEIRDIRI
jgi:flagellar hook-basal body complex protein FliE